MTSSGMWRNVMWNLQTFRRNQLSQSSRQKMKRNLLLWCAENAPTDTTQCSNILSVPSWCRPKNWSHYRHIFASIKATQLRCVKFLFVLIQSKIADDWVRLRILFRNFQLRMLAWRPLIRAGWWFFPPCLILFNDAVHYTARTSEVLGRNRVLVPLCPPQFSWSSSMPK